MRPTQMPDFLLRMHRALAAPGKNFFFSPTSIWSWSAARSSSAASARTWPRTACANCSRCKSHRPGAMIRQCIPPTPLSPPGTPRSTSVSSGTAWPRAWCAANIAARCGCKRRFIRKDRDCATSSSCIRPRGLPGATGCRSASNSAPTRRPCSPRRAPASGTARPDPWRSRP